jgi:hypothetical protein
MPRPEIQAERGPAPWPHDDVKHYDACSDIDVLHAAGVPPPLRWACRRRWKRHLFFPE